MVLLIFPIVTFSVIVDDFDIDGMGLDPSRADSPLVVDPNTVLPRAIARKGLETVARNCRKIGYGGRRMNLIQLSLGGYANALELSVELTPEDLTGIFVPERSNHYPRILP
jgi:hypothetical protein